MKELRFHRQSRRLKGYDYTQAGGYFITFCTQYRKNLFGKIVAGKMVLNEAGKIAADCWLQIPDHFPNAELDEWVVMPNHIHGVVVLTPAGANNYSPPQPQQTKQKPTGTTRTIGSIVRGFKIGITKWFRQQNNTAQIWQRDYWEHIVRNEPEMDRIRQYIINNPANWEADRLARQAEIGKGKVREPQSDYGREDWMV